MEPQQRELAEQEHKLGQTLSQLQQRVNSFCSQKEVMKPCRPDRGDGRAAAAPDPVIPGRLDGPESRGGLPLTRGRAPMRAARGAARLRASAADGSSLTQAVIEGGVPDVVDGLA
jgi:hypothetical protein